MPPLKARHTWTHDQRLTLHLLHDTSLTLDRHQRTQTFNTIYADQLRRSGYPDGFPVGTLNSQYREHSKLNSPSPPSSLVAIWRPILQAPATEAEATKRDLIREQILKVAKSLVTTARGSRDGPVDAKKRKRACAPADRAGRRYETDVGRAHEGLQLIDSDSEDVSPSLASGWTKRTASKFPQWRLDSRHVAYAIDEEESDFDAVVKRPLKRSRITRFSLECDDQPPNATPNRPKRTTSQFSKWTFDSSHAVAADKDADLDSDFLPESSPGLSRFSRSSPAVVVPGILERRDHIAKEKRGPTSVMKPKKPNLKKSTPKKPTAMKTPPSIVRRKEIATVEYHRPNGTIMLTPAEFAATKEPYVTPSEAEAHPPLAGLLFRYWTDDSFSKTNDRGDFVAGKFARFSAFGAGSPPLPKLKDFAYFWQDVGEHMNREPTRSPFISTCNMLDWIIRLAVQESRKGVTSGRITLLDANQLDRASVFHAQFFHRQLCKKFPFTDGAHRYQGKREFMIYHKISKEAILHTFAVRDLIRLAASKQDVGNLLRLDKLTKAGFDTAQKTLASQKLKLSAHTSTAIATVAQFLGLSPDSATEHIMHVVSDMVQGWGLLVRYQTPEQWSSVADAFAAAMIKPSVTTRSMKSYQKLKLAFLDGVRWSRGDVNARHCAKKMRIMLFRAKKIGLDDPAKILRDELDAAKLAIAKYDQKQQRLLQGGGNVGLLSAEAEEEEEEEEGVTLPRTPRSGGMRIDDDILYDTDED